MIPVGTLCIVKYAHAHSAHLIGKTCVVVRHVPKDEHGQDLVIDIEGGTMLAADKCLMPLTPPPDPVAVLKAEELLK
jgi:hypothetical protein